MRDLFKKLRCGKGNADAGKNASGACEEKTADEEENIANNETGKGDEEEKLLNGDLEDGEKKEEDDEKKEKENKEPEKENEEDGIQEEKGNAEQQNEESDANIIENEKEEEKLLQEEGEGSTECNKKNKKEPSKWMCGLGKKSSEKKHKVDKKSKTPSKKVAVNEEEKSTDEEQNLNKEGEKENENDDKNVVKDEAKDDEETSKKEEEQKSELHEENKGNPSDMHDAEEVVVFVDEGEAVVDDKGANTNSVSKEECCVKGEGLFNATKGMQASFDVNVSSDDSSNFKCQIHDQNGNEVEIVMEAIEDNIHKVTYCPNSTGLHSIEATWKGNQVIGSPFQVDVKEQESE